MKNNWILRLINVLYILFALFIFGWFFRLRSRIGFRSGNFSGKIDWETTWQLRLTFVVVEILFAVILDLIIQSIRYIGTGKFKLWIRSKIRKQH